MYLSVEILTFFLFIHGSQEASLSPSPAPPPQGRQFDNALFGELADENSDSDGGQYWKGGIVPYEISNTFSETERNNILLAMEQISNKTSGCIKFTQRKNEPDYLKIIRGFGCTSSVGRRGGPQISTLTHGCLEKLGDIQHNLVHVLRFFHEHSRPDRDEHVSINWDNIAKENKSQFKIIANMNTFGLPYDYDSVLHYPSNAFAVNRSLPTIIPKPKLVRIGQAENLSTLDVARIRAAYKCG